MLTEERYSTRDTRLYFHIQDRRQPGLLQSIAVELGFLANTNQLGQDSNALSRRRSSTPDVTTGHRTCSLQILTHGGSIR